MAKHGKPNWQVLRDANLQSMGYPASATAERDLLRASVDSMLDPFVVLTAVRGADGGILDFVFTEANAAACAFNGLSYEELIGVPLLGHHPAAGTTDLFERYVHVVETGEPLVLHDWSYPQDMLGGQVRRYDVRGFKVGDGLVQTWRDVTDTPSFRLAASEEMFRLAFDHSSIGMCLVSPLGQFVRVNPALCRMLDRPQTRLLECTWQELTHPEDLDVDLAHVDDVLHDRIQDYRLLKRFLKPDGTLVWGDLSVSCVRNADRTVRHFV